MRVMDNYQRREKANTASTEGFGKEPRGRVGDAVPGRRDPEKEQVARVWWKHSVMDRESHWTQPSQPDRQALQGGRRYPRSSLGLI